MDSHPAVVLALCAYGRSAAITRSLSGPCGWSVVRATSLFSSAQRGTSSPTGKIHIPHSCLFFLKLLPYICGQRWGLRMSTTNVPWCKNYLTIISFVMLFPKYCINTISCTCIVLSSVISSFPWYCRRQLEEKFDLFYYDGLAHQDEEIRLTIGTSVRCHSELLPSYHSCQQFQYSKVCWNA